jgi:hypothetical protein
LKLETSGGWMVLSEHVPTAYMWDYAAYTSTCGERTADYTMLVRHSDASIGQ